MGYTVKSMYEGYSKRSQPDTVKFLAEVGRPRTPRLFYNGIRALEKCWTKYTSVAEDCVEK